MKLRNRIGIGTLAGIALAGLFGMIPAHAHNALVSSNPAAGSVVTEQIGTFSFTTSDGLLDSGEDSPTTFLQVRGPGATELYYGDGCATVDGASVTMPVQLGEAGDYTVYWGAVSADGHPITGEYTFSWQPATGQDLAEGLPAAPTCGAAAPGTAEPEATEGPAETADPVAESDDQATAASNILWIGIGLGVLVAGGIVVLLIVRRRNRLDAVDAPSRPDTN